MKEFIKKKIKIITIFMSGLIVIIIGIILAINISNERKQLLENMTDVNNYVIKEKVIEMPGTKVISNDALKSTHCLKDVCISNVTIYADGKDGRIECLVKNNSEKTISDYLKIKINDNSLVIAYDNLRPGKESKSTVRYSGMDFTNITDYSLKELTAKEKKKFIK